MLEWILLIAYFLIALAFVDVHQARGAKLIRTYLLSFIWPYCLGRYIANRVEKEVTHEINKDN